MPEARKIVRFAWQNCGNLLTVRPFGCAISLFPEIRGQNYTFIREIGNKTGLFFTQKKSAFRREVFIKSNHLKNREQQVKDEEVQNKDESVLCIDECI